MTELRRGHALIRALDSRASPEAVAVLTSSANEPAILETLMPTPAGGRFSIFAADPVETLSICTLETHPLKKLKERAKSYELACCLPCEIPFVGGWAGHISYEAGCPARLVPPRPPVPHDPALLHFALYDQALVFDHHTNQWWATAIEWETDLPARPRTASRLQVLRNRLATAETLRLPDLQSLEPISPQALLSPEQYHQRVGRIKEYIEAGDVYQVNLGQRFRVPITATPIDLYRLIRKRNPAPFAALLAWDDAAIISASPELFLELRGDHVVTRPIKGTRPRTGGAADIHHRTSLEESEKEHAELNMIIDLLRNDLGRVCQYGSVRVVDAGSIEEHPTVFHRVANIEGRLAQGRTWYDILEASFPGGSIVGAPKIRAMQIIREIEPFARGPYCGAIGWIGLDGNMTLSIAIRTLVHRRGFVDVFAGGGIVAESSAAREYDEILAKAAGLLRSLNAEVRTADHASEFQTAGAA